VTVAVETLSLCLWWTTGDTGSFSGSLWFHLSNSC